MRTPKKQKNKAYVDVSTPMNTSSSKQTSLYDFFKKTPPASESLQKNNLSHDGSFLTSKSKAVSPEKRSLIHTNLFDASHSDSSSTTKDISDSELCDIDEELIQVKSNTTIVSNKDSTDISLHGSLRIPLSSFSVTSTSTKSAPNSASDSYTLKRRLSLDASSDSEHSDSTSSNSINCPFCVKNRQRQMKRNAEMEIQFIKENQFNSFLYQDFEGRLPAHRKFCQKHREQFLVEKACKEGWPMKNEIRLDDLKSRLENFRFIFDELLFNDVSPLSFLKDDIFNEFFTLGSSTFRSRKHLISILKRIRVGYYGSEGQRIITEILHTMYMDKEVFPPDIFKPLCTVEFVQLIFVPAAGVLLIREDLSKKRNDGKKVSYNDAYNYMLLTSDYGEFIHPHN